MSFSFVIKPGDGAAESLNGGDTKHFSSTPVAGEIVSFWLPQEMVEAKVSKVSHVYFESRVHTEYIPTFVHVTVPRKIFNRMVDEYSLDDWNYYDHTC